MRIPDGFRPTGACRCQEHAPEFQQKRPIRTETLPSGPHVRPYPPIAESSGTLRLGTANSTWVA